MATPIGTNNSMAPQANAQLARSSKNLSISGKDISEGRISNLQPVDQVTVNRLNDTAGTLSAVQKGVSYVNSQIQVVRNSTTGIKKDLMDIKDAIISASNKSDEQRAAINQTIAKKIDLVNKQIRDANFGDRHLLGGEHFNVDMRTGENSSDTYQIIVKALDTLNNGNQAAGLVKHGFSQDNSDGIVNEVVEKGFYGKGDLQDAIKSVAKKVIDANGVETNDIRKAMRNAISEVRNGKTIESAGLADADRVNLENIIKAGPDAIAFTIDAAIAGRVVSTKEDDDTVTGLEFKAYEAANEFGIKDDASVKASEAVINDFIRVIDATLNVTNSYTDFLSSTSDTIASKVKVTEDSANLFSKTDIVKAAQQFQEYLTQMKLSLNLLASGQRLTEEALQSAISSLRS